MEGGGIGGGERAVLVVKTLIAGKWTFRLLMR